MNSRIPRALFIVLLTILASSLAPSASGQVIEYGDTIAGSLDVVGEVDEYTFEVQEGDVVILRLAERTPELELILVVTSPNSTSWGDFGYRSVELVIGPLTRSGTYTVRVGDHWDETSGQYDLHIHRINNPPGAETLHIGDTIAGALVQPTATRAYLLAANAGDRFLLRMIEEAPEGAFSPEFRVYLPDGTRVVLDNDSNAAEINAAILPISGIYTVLAMDYGATEYGNYRFHCQRLNDPVSATPISYGQTVTGDLSQPAETDAFTFSGADLDRVLARLIESEIDTEPLLRLYGPDGDQVTGDSDFTLAELPLSRLPGSGTYTLLVMDNPGTDTGGYSLHIQCINDPSGAGTLLQGDTVSGTVDQPATTQAYLLAANAGDRFLLRMVEDAGSGALAPELRIYEPDGTFIELNHDNIATEINAVELPLSGVYTVLAMDFGASDYGDYWLHCQCLNDPASATAISYGQTVTGDLSQRAETDAFTFSGANLDRVLARLVESEIDTEPLLRLYGPDGDQVTGAVNFFLAELPLDPLPVSGTYTLLVMDNPGTDTGGYSLHIQSLNDPAGAGTLLQGNTISGAVDQPAATQAYLLAANAGDRFLLRMVEDTGSGALAPELRVYEPDGTFITLDHDNIAVEFNTAELPLSGVYTVLAMDFGASDFGNYWLHCQCTNDPLGAVLIEYGDSYGSELEYRTETHAYQFAGAADDSLYATMTEYDYLMEPLLRLYDPEGVQIASAFGFAEAEISGLYLPSDGIYTLLAMDSPGTDIGSYRLDLLGGSGASSVPDQEDPDLLPVTATALHGCQPNPFNPSTRISFDLPRRAATRLSIHSLDGRRLVTLADGILPEGRHTAVWNGCDQAGRQVATGVYFVRLLADGEQMVKRVTLLK
ncbi:MAG: hypothetical protein GY838_19810 [bacterium]|nr:hypothetical protein [bacterium]